MYAVTFAISSHLSSRSLQLLCKPAVPLQPVTNLGQQRSDRFAMAAQYLPAVAVPLLPVQGAVASLAQHALESAPHAPAQPW